MKTALFASLAFIAATDALVARNGNCCFALNASGADGAKGTVGQLTDGQNRVYGSLPSATYCINAAGGITDGSGRGCILTPPTTQFQCDVGASPLNGFSIACDGTVAVHGNSHFYECPTGDKGENNIYTTPPSGQEGCFEVTLEATSCLPSCSAPPPQPPAPKACPVGLTNPYQYPHEIIPVSSTAPDKVPGTSYFGSINPTTASLYVFDIPLSYAGQTCTLEFFLPTAKDLKTSSYTITGSGALDFAKLQANPNQGTTFNSKPGIATDYGVTSVSPGGSYSIATFDCPAGSQISFEISSSGGTSLTYFQDYNPAAIGLYIVSCS